MTRTLHVVGLGSGDPAQLTGQAVAALRGAAYAVAPRKARADGGDDPLVAVRRDLLTAVAPGLELVEVPDPERDRSARVAGDAAAYRGAVADWHAARTAAYEQLLLERPGDVAFLVWGDPAFYDSTLRVVDAVLAGGRVRAEVRVVPGISSLQLLAAAHRIVLHEVGQPITVTTGRRLREAVDAGADNVLVMLNAGLDLAGLEDWTIWWGANLAATGERLVAGRVGDVLGDVLTARDAAKAEAGWVMDCYLLRRPARA
ncbi:precorrin-6A synthase (deacetylating) [Nocardioides sp. ChNu-99]|uniref:precorrin-6A synthase (deacetylating) n=1 Tax=Nocardioides sp. ChNu-99 TaxID=2839897 RepID=UPI002405DE4A|nr:precorrin-6A synthase (deacetylating) [Nocardioides sp. ChNu-99]MDF9717448.1 precorrin-6A synthase (deacetylating) [Nocardioides sp. ChNu-99]